MSCARIQLSVLVNVLAVGSERPLQQEKIDQLCIEVLAVTLHRDVVVLRPEAVFE